MIQVPELKNMNEVFNLKFYLKNSDIENIN
jgi:hypothetical protein